MFQPVPIIFEMICFESVISMIGALFSLSLFLFVRNLNVYIIISDFIFLDQITTAVMNLQFFEHYF